ncbi:MAG: uracil-DNA glycosylase [Pyrinomonadaceae bacterium]
MNDEMQQLIADVRERVAMMGELGVESMDVKLAPEPKPMVDSVVSAQSAHPPTITSNLKSEISDRSIQARNGSRLDSLPSLVDRPTAIPIRKTASTTTSRADPVTSVVANEVADLVPLLSQLPAPIETIDQIRAEIGPDCTRCTLGTLGRKQVVNSVGDLSARLMFVGEAPGKEEDELGFPFVGRAGKLLTQIIEGIGISRDNVFIGNINRCRPPNNRPPTSDETVTCRPFLLREVAVIRPRVIVVLGNTATQNLLDIKTPISKLRGNFQDYFGVKVMPTFHPAYLLRDPHKKREVWEDMKQVRDYLNSTTA